jgi:hypothetical protein
VWSQGVTICNGRGASTTATWSEPVLPIILARIAPPAAGAGILVFVWMTNRPRLVALAATFAITALASACSRERSESTVTLVGVPGHVNEHISMAGDGGAFLALVWSASSASTGTNIFASVSADGGQSFSAPVRVNAVDRQASVNGEQPPRVALVRGPDGTSSIVVLWTAKGSEGTSLLSSRSTDGGRTFGPAISMPGVDARGNRGWESMAAAGDGQLYALWLDHRDAARASSSHARHEHGPGTPSDIDGVARAQRSQLFLGSLDGSLAPKGIARGVCYCCKTALTTGADGTVYAAWRHVYAGNRRDIAFAMSRDGGRSFDAPVRVSEDDWQLDGCPENGPALTLDASRRVHVVWPTLVRQASGETLRLFHASTVDGRVFTSRAALPTTGVAYHPQLIVASDGALVAAWDEAESGKRYVKLARGRVEPSGEVAFSLVPLRHNERGSYPALAATSAHVVLAWAQRGDQESKIAVTRITF